MKIVLLIAALACTGLGLFIADIIVSGHVWNLINTSPYQVVLKNFFLLTSLIFVLAASYRSNIRDNRNLKR